MVDTQFKRWVLKNLGEYYLQIVVDFYPEFKYLEQTF